LYTLPALIVTENCGIDTAYFTVSGATSRNGNNDASGMFNPGVSYIHWVVKDIHGNEATATTTIDIKIPESLIIRIADVWAVAPYGSPNTLYLGLGPTTMTLRARATTGTPPYTYEWRRAGSATVISKRDSLIVGAEGEYSVKITDYNGNHGSIARQVNMLDVRCGNNDEKVAVCHIPQGHPENAKTICVSKNAVNTFLLNGSYIGNCNSGRTANPAIAEEASKFTVYPNPTYDKLTVTLSSQLGSKAEILLINQNGSTVLKKTYTLNSANQLAQLSIGKFTPGVYMLKVITDKLIKTEKVILRR
jgi:hypothetical protein